MATGCAGDAYTRETVNLTSEAKGELRYSPSCDAAWVRTVSWSREVPISGTVYGQIYWNYKWVSFWAESTPGDVAGRTQWSPMVGGFPHYDISVTG